MSNKKTDTVESVSDLDSLIVAAYRVVTSNFSWCDWLDRLIEIVGADEAWIESRDTDVVTRMVAHTGRSGSRSMEYVSCVVVEDGAVRDVMVVRGRDIQSARPCLEDLQPHVGRVLQLQRSLDAGRERLKLVARVLTDSISVGVIVLHGYSHMVVSCNVAARNLATTNSGFAIVNGRFVISRRSEADVFKHAIESVQNPINAVGRHVNIGGAEHGISLLCYRLDHCTDNNLSSDVSQCVAVFVSSAEELPAIRLEYLRTEFSLTPKEIRLSLGLAHGKSVETLAADFNLSRHTLRAQLKSILKKTGARSQSGLVRLLLEDPRLLFAPAAGHVGTSMWP